MASRRIILPGSGRAKYILHKKKQRYACSSEHLLSILLRSTRKWCTSVKLQDPWPACLQQNKYPLNHLPQDEGNQNQNMTSMFILKTPGLTLAIQTYILVWWERISKTHDLSSFVRLNCQKGHQKVCFSISASSHHLLFNIQNFYEW